MNDGEDDVEGERRDEGGFQGVVDERKCNE